MDDIILQMQNINKSFNKIKVLKDVSIDLEKGTVYGLIGENGAGKSTLMKILTGVYEKDSGDIIYKGNKVEMDNPRKAKEMGISIVHQELSLISSLSVMENIYLGNEDIRRCGLIDYKSLEIKAQKLLDELDVSFDPKTKVSDLTIANRQIVEIAKALSIKSDILVLDEPTSSLTQSEIQQLFSIIRKLKSQGKSIIYISHHMDEIYEITDKLIILRDGERVYTGKVSDVTEDDIIRYMVGREMSNFIPSRATEPGEIVIDVKNLSKRDKLEDISFNIRAGEIVGFAGLVGAGRTDLAKVIFGLDSYDEGQIEYEGKPVHIKSTTQTTEMGMAYVPEERRKEGLLLISEIYKNISLKFIDKDLLIDRREELKLSKDMSKALRVKSRDIYQEVRELSGGNQQKVILARCLSLKPKLLILDEPTRGIDINSKAEIYNIIQSLAETGVSIMLISSEMTEILSLCDRIQVMKAGRIVKELSKAEADQEKIMYYALGGIDNGN